MRHSIAAATFSLQVCISATTGCAAAPLADEDQEIAATAAAPLTADISAALATPGQGYNSITGQYRGTSCAATRVTSLPVNAVTESLHRIDTHRQFASELSMRADADASFGIYSASANGTYAAQTASDERSLSLYYEATAIARQDTAAVTPSAAIAENDWYTRCGDRYVSAINKGARFFLAYEIAFQTAAERQAFEASASADGLGLFDANARVKSLSTGFSGRATVRIRTFQRGGSVAGIANLPPSLVSCSITSMGACDAAVTSAVNYARDSLLGSARANGAVDLEYFTQDWGAARPTPALPADVADKRAAILDRYERAIGLERRIATIRSAGYFGGPQWFRAGVDALATTLDLDIRRTVPATGLETAIRRCFDDLDVNNANSRAACTGFALPPARSGSPLELPMNGGDWQGRVGDFVTTITPEIGLYGTVKPWRMCPAGQHVVGVAQRVEGPQGGGYEGGADDTGLNQVDLICQTVARTSATSRLVSHVGAYGTMYAPKLCPSGALVGMQVKFETSQGSGDDSAANGVKIRCSDEHEYTPAGEGAFGRYPGAWASDVDCVSSGAGGCATRCPAGTAVCGYRVIYEDTRGGVFDDTTLNGVELACCRY